MNQKIHQIIDFKCVRDWLLFGKDFLKNAGVESYSLDAELILMFVLDFSRVQIFTNGDYVLSERERESYLSFLEKRSHFMPVSYITGKREFMGLDFFVNPSTLIPRGDTEVLVEYAIDFINKNNFKSVLDIGTGSGAIAVSIARYCPDVNVVASDISREALKTAEKNAEINGVLDRIEIIQSDIFQNVGAKFDLIVSNPPYIKTSIISTLMPDVKDYEPVSALDGGDDGLYYYRKIIYECKSFLNKYGGLIFEIGYDQAFEVSELLRKSEFKNIDVKQDFAGLDRVVLCVYL